MKAKFFLAMVPTFFLSNLASASTCIFGEELNDLIASTNTTFVVKELGSFVKISRVENETNPIRVKVVELTTPNKHEVFHVNYTFEDQFDGGNSFGWIENYNTLQIVATIQDSYIYDCKL